MYLLLIQCLNAKLFDLYRQQRSLDVQSRSVCMAWESCQAVASLLTPFGNRAYKHNLFIFYL